MRDFESDDEWEPEDFSRWKPSRKRLETLAAVVLAIAGCLVIYAGVGWLYELATFETTEDALARMEREEARREPPFSEADRRAAERETKALTTPRTAGVSTLEVDGFEEGQMVPVARTEAALETYSSILSEPTGPVRDGKLERFILSGGLMMVPNGSAVEVKGGVVRLEIEVEESGESGVVPAEWVREVE